MANTKVLDEAGLPVLWEQIKDRVVPLEGGGTGVSATTPEEALTALGGMGRMGFLWKNASPTSNFEAQTVSTGLDLSKFDWFIATFARHTANDRELSVLCRFGEYTIASVAGYYSYNGGYYNGYARSMLIDSSGFTFTNGTIAHQSGGGAITNSSVIIPKAICGFISNIN